jgi:S-adenosylmethionine hydrolase
VGGGQSVLVGPDNGLFAPAVAMVGGAGRTVELTNADFHLPAPGPTFAGRDVFAPVVANLCLGVDLAELGELVDPITLLPGVLPITHEADGALMVEVLWIDRFGNAQLNVDPDDVDGWGDRIRLVWGDRSRVGVRAKTYGDVKPGEIGLVVDSYGLLSITVDQGSAATELGLHASDRLALERLEDDDVDGSLGVTTNVELTPRDQR